MKTLLLAATGLAALAPLAATAQTRTVTTRTVMHTHEGPAYDGRHSRQVCHMEHHRHRDVRVCRTERY